MTEPTNPEDETPIETYARPHAGWKWEILSIEDEETGYYFGRVYSPMVGEDGTLGYFTQDQLDDIGAQKID